MPPAKSLYIHIPFCRSKCAYCDFFSVPCGSVPDSYLDALLAELDFHAHSGNLDRLDTVYIGGGTPSMMSHRQIERVLGAVLPLCGSGAEVTAEVNPESLDKGLLHCLSDNGVNRISVGIQSLDDAALSFVRRRGGSRECRSALELLCSEGAVFSADMIAGLPRQEGGSFVRGLRELSAFRPSHISLYALAVEDSTPLSRMLREGLLECPDDAAGELWIAGRDVLESLGYVQYEVSNFAPPGNECRHNTAYWRQLPYAGAGAGATGTLYRSADGGRLTGGFRYTNTTDIGAYTAYWLSGGADVARSVPPGEAIPSDAPAVREVLDADTLAFEFCMLALRTRRGILSAEYGRRFGRELDTSVFERYNRRSLVDIVPEEGGVRCAMSRDGLLFLNAFLSEL